MRFFFALPDAILFVVMDADCTNAYSNAPPPTQSVYVRFDDDSSRHGNEADRSLVLPVLKALQGHPEADALRAAVSPLKRASRTAIPRATTA
jgi:hypothetical protein